MQPEDDQGPPKPQNNIDSLTPSSNPNSSSTPNPASRVNPGPVEPAGSTLPPSQNTNQSGTPVQSSATVFNIGASNTQPAQTAQTANPTPQPVPINNYPNQPADFNMGPPNKRPWLKIGLIVLIILIVLGSIGAYLYINYLNNKPEKVLSDALSNTMTDLLDRKPLSSVSNLSFESTEDTNSVYTVKLDVKFAEANNNSDTSAVLQFKNREIDLTLKASAVSIGSKEVYVKFDDLQKSLQSLANSSPDLKPLINDSSIKKIDGRWIKLASPSLADVGFVRSKDQADKCSKAFEELRVKKEDKEKIGKIFQKNQFISAIKEQPKQVINGENSFHYSIGLDEEKTINFTKQLVELPSFASLKKDCDIKQQDLDKLIAEIKKQKDTNQTKPSVELWVGEKSRLPTKISVNYKDKTVSSVFSSTVKINANNINITAPNDYIDYKDLDKQIQQSIYNFSSSPNFLQ